MKQFITTVMGLMLLGVWACTGNKGVAADATGENGGDSAATEVVAVESDTLVFEVVELRDSSEYKVKIVDYSSDEDPAPYDIATVMDAYEASTLKAVAGKPKVVEFINQWLTLDAAGRYVEAPVTAEKVAKEYASLKAQGVPDVRAALKLSAAEHLGSSDSADDEEEMMEMPFESANEYSSSISMVWQTPSLLTLWDSGYDYSAGAAHGMPWGIGKTFDLKNLRILTFDDIITKAGHEAVLKMIIETLKDDYADGWEMFNSEETIDFPESDPSLVEKGVAFDYGAYEIGAYALGMPQAILPYEKVKPYLTAEVKELLNLKE